MNTGKRRGRIEKPKFSKAEIAYLTFLVVLVIALASGWYLHYSAVMCWIGGIAFKVYDLFLAIFQLVIAAFVIWKIFTFRVMGVIGGVLLYGILLKLPEFATIVFGLGASCG
ncbi:hypothetical protein HFO51_06330 [Rhizobium leguminosarum]|uniref:hypothetical protein n=1 Tax=Rhizobium leguminosarum TaxID=384 RepID=UPI001C9381C3|nr:hypothetical protein [Rhizobium leguminosarum]MBY5594084.1 hypothetical protein [Rhizobium leguminosarum]